ncbi:hypothetical protein NQ006_03005 [Pediococcus pentosaceus]|uniref:hypothetical protein n=2 Tax=Pediococcus pentosaceus TaxID=1255 RepID=UPI001EC7B9A3|nr:hypothetical protein [Pediococcus pentosaceus]MBF7136403.1 hypothetical protein [Pediococcus pentosaceus]MCQ9315761.1 hypothetical protein [Pediococcus pentosaceus]MCQ9339482.1 hypothetical protein [Pediococcus pentosaceus]
MELRATKLNRRSMAFLEFMEYGFEAIQKNDTEIKSSTSHERLEEIANQYSLFIYQTKQVVAQLADMCDGIDSSLSTVSRDIEEHEIRDTKLQRLLKLLQNRRTPEELNIPINNEPASKFIAEQDSLLMIVEELLSGNDNDFEKDMADFELETFV